MLGSLARKLRALGLDTAYFRSGDDRDLLSLAESGGKIILTSDRGLATMAARRRTAAVFVVGRNDKERAQCLARALRELDLPVTLGDPFCSVCGDPLEKVRRRDVSGEVPCSVEARHRLFYRCTRCGKVYWRGSHWKRLRTFALILRGR